MIDGLFYLPEMLGLELGTGDKPQEIKGYRILHTDKFPRKGIKYLDADKPFPFQDNSFDLVIAYGVLEHFNDFYFTINEIHRVLKVGGLFKCDFPQFASVQYFWEGDDKRMSHSRIFHSYVEEFGDKGMRQQSQNRRFELKRFDYTITFGRVLKPIINAIGFRWYEAHLARTMPLNIDFVYFDLVKKGEWE